MRNVVKVMIVVGGTYAECEYEMEEGCDCDALGQLDVDTLVEVAGEALIDAVVEALGGVPAEQPKVLS